MLIPSFSPRRVVAVFVATFCGLLLTTTASSQSHFWNHSNSGNWNDAGQWTPNSVPNGATDWPDMSVSSATPYTITLNVDVLLGQLDLLAGNATLAAAGRTVTLNGPAQIGPGGGTVLWLLSSHWLGAGTLTNDAHILAQGNSTIENLLQRGTMRVLANGASSHTTLAITGSASNTGAMEMESLDAAYNNTILMDPGVIFNNSGTLHTLPGSGGSRNINGAFTNTGTLNLDFNTSFPTGPFTLDGGTVNIGTGASLLMPTGTTFIHNGGNIASVGLFDMTSGIYQFKGGSLSGTRARLRNSTLDIDPVHTGSGDFLLESTSGFSGNLWPGQSVLVQGNGHGTNATTTITGDHSNTGLWQLDAQNAGYNVKLIQSPGSRFTNHGTVEFLTGSNGSRTVEGDFHNAFDGIVRAEYDTKFDLGPILSEGVFLMESGATMTFEPGTTFTMAAGTLDVQGDFTHTSGVDFWTGGTTLGTPKLTHSELHLDGNDTAVFDLVMRGASSLSGDVGSQGKLRLRGDGVGTNSIFTVASGATNRGAMTMETENSTYVVNLDATGAVFTNDGLFEVLQGTNGTRNILGGFTNNGTVDMQYHTSFSGGTVQNDGLWTIQADQNMLLNSTAVFIQNDGTFNPIGLFRHTGGSDRLLGGTMTGQPSFINSALEFGPAFSSVFDGTVGGLSTLTGAPAAGQKLTLLGDSVGSHATLTLAESVTNEGLFEIVSNGAAFNENLTTGAFTFTNAGTFRTSTGSNGARAVSGSFHNTGTVDIAYDAAFNIGPIRNSGDWTVQLDELVTMNAGSLFEMDAGSLNVDGDFLHVNGSDRLLGGTVNGFPRFRSNALEFGPGFITNDAIRVEGISTLSGDVPASANLKLVGASGGSHQSLTLTTPSTIAGNLEMVSENAAFSTTLNALAGNDLTLTGSLTINEGAAGNRIINGALINQGTVTVDRIATLNTGPLTNAGSFTVNTGKTFTVTSGVAFEQQAGSLNVDGTFLLANGAALFSGGTVNGIPFLRASDTEFGAGFTNPGTVQLEGVGTFLGTVAPGQILRISGNSGGSHTNISVAAGLLNQGTLQLDSANAGFSSQLNLAAGTFVNEGAFESLQGASGVRNLGAEVDNRGTMDFHLTTTVGTAGHNHVNSGIITHHAGNLIVSGDSFTNQAGGRVDGIGTLNFSALTDPPQNDGVWAPGLSAGLMTLTGDWVQGSAGALEIEIGGYNPSTEYDRLNVSGTASLDGTIQLKTINGFAPKFGDQFTILTAGSVTGTFSSITVQGDLNLGHTLDVIYTPTSVIAQVVERVILAGADPTVLTLSGPVPGLAGQNNFFQVDGATGHGNVVLVWGTSSGLTSVSGCPGLFFGIANAQQGGQAPASVHGTALIQAFVPGAASGVAVLFQALDVERCLLTAVGGFTFP